MDKPTYFTKEGLQKLKDDLTQLITVERPKISLQIAEAREKGDLSENAEYDAAKDAQGMLEMKISHMQGLIINSRLIDETKRDNSIIRLLSTVKIRNCKTSQEMKYTIVPDQEADLKLGKIAVNSPIANALIGKVVGDEVEVVAPAGKLNFSIVEIQ